MNLEPRRVRKGVAVGGGAFVLFGIVTGLIPNPLYVRMIPRTVLDYLFLTTTAALVGVYAAQRPVSEEESGHLAIGSTVGGFLAFGCPIYNVFLLALFSSSALMTYFDPLRPLLGVVSTGLLGGLVYYRSQNDCETCGTDATAEEPTENHS
ncbi:hypothetical protein [Halorussus halophilus]|uniref:hypothetical protein n=1 Tax=Halorussus halophilus TaxID=2650975 RepID=UPI0013018FF2|nr:hypothetical protein [Halorussus halophilus]